MLAGNLPHEEEQTMAEPQMVDPHDVVMTGENSFIRLSNDGVKTLTDRVSHWRVLWSPAGQGHALFVESSLLNKIAVYSDNAGLVRYLQRTIEPLLYKEFGDESLPGLVRDLDPAQGLKTVNQRRPTWRRHIGWCVTGRSRTRKHGARTPSSPSRRSSSRAGASSCAECPPRPTKAASTSAWCWSSSTASKRPPRRTTVRATRKRCACSATPSSATCESSKASASAR